MNRNKKLTVIGFIIIILIEQTIPTATGTIEELNINTQYFQQETTYYCGQAVVQMILVQKTGVTVPQDELADEMKVIENWGTKIGDMRTPLVDRGLEVVDEGKRRNINHLVNAVDAGQLSIILIDFDVDSSSGHYVLVTGYNQDGVIVQDPWTESWSVPDGRNAGEDTVLGYELVEDLWIGRSGWVLTVDVPTVTEVDA
jgi:hypothetical protein